MAPSRLTTTVVMGVASAGVLPVLLFGRGDRAHPLRNVLNVRGGDRPTMVLLKVGLHRAHVELRILMADLTGEQGGRPTHDPRLVLERTVDAPAVRALVDRALDLHRPVWRLVLLRIAPARVQRDVAKSDRAAVGVETRQRLRGDAAPDRVVASWIARSSRLPLSCTVTSIVTASPDRVTTVATAAPSFSCYRRLQDTP